MLRSLKCILCNLQNCI